MAAAASAACSSAPRAGCCSNVAGGRSRRAGDRAHLEGVAKLRDPSTALVSGRGPGLYEAAPGGDQRARRRRPARADLITLRFLDQLLDILRVAQERTPTRRGGARVLSVSGALHVPWIRNAIFESAKDDRWEQRAAQALVADLGRAHHRLVGAGDEEPRGAGSLIRRRRR